MKCIILLAMMMLAVCEGGPAMMPMPNGQMSMGGMGIRQFMPSRAKRDTPLPIDETTTTTTTTTTTLKPLIESTKPIEKVDQSIPTLDTTMNQPDEETSVSKVRREVDEKKFTTTTSTTELPPKKIRETAPASPPLRPELSLDKKEEELSATDLKSVQSQDLPKKELEGGELPEKNEADDLKVLPDDKLTKPTVTEEVKSKPKRRDTIGKEEAVDAELIKKDDPLKPAVVDKPKRATPEIPHDDVKPAKDTIKPELLNRANPTTPLLNKTDYLATTKPINDAKVHLPSSELPLPLKPGGELTTTTKKVTRDELTVAEMGEKKKDVSRLDDTEKTGRTRRSSYGSPTRVSFAVRQAPVVRSEYSAPAARIETPVRAEYGSRVKSEYSAPAVRSSSYEQVREAPIRSASYETVRQAPTYEVVREIVREVPVVRSSSYEQVREAPIRSASYETVREAPRRSSSYEVEDVPVRSSSYETVREIPVRSSYSEQPIRVSMDTYQPSQVRESSRYRRDTQEGESKLPHTQFMKSGMNMKLGPGMMFKM